MPLDVESESFGKFIIRSANVAGAWQARAFKGRKAITSSAVGVTRKEAVDSVKAALREQADRLQSGRGADGTPSALEYAEAFDAIGKLPAAYEAMLEAHLDASDHLITATKLAAAAGYANWSAANLHYGILARRLAEELDYSPPLRENGTPMWTYTLATAAAEGELEPEQIYAALERSLELPHFEWLLRPQVVEALLGVRD